MDALQVQLSRVVFLYWQVPAREGRVLVRVLRRSSCSRAQTLRQQLALLSAAYPTLQGWRAVDGTHVFGAVITPAFMIRLLTDLRSTGSLSPTQVRVVERCVLDTTSATGAWKPRD